MTHRYVRTVQPASAVTHCLVASLARGAQHLVVCRGRSLSVYSVRAHGQIDHLHTTSINGNVAALQLFRPKRAGGERMDDGDDLFGASAPAKDQLFVLTDHRAYCVVEFDAGSNAFQTVTNGDLTDHVGAMCDGEAEFLCCADPRARLVGATVYDGVFKALPVDARSGRMRPEHVWTARLAEMEVLDLAFLDATNPTLVVLHQDDAGQRHATTYRVDLAARELHAGPWTLADLDKKCNALVTTPTGGLFAFGEREIAYFDGDESHAKSFKRAAVAVRALGDVLWDVRRTRPERD